MAWLAKPSHMKRFAIRVMGRLDTTSGSALLASLRTNQLASDDSAMYRSSCIGNDAGLATCIPARVFTLARPPFWIKKLLPLLQLALLLPKLISVGLAICQHVCAPNIRICVWHRDKG